jgi:hypothetical protein
MDEKKSSIIHSISFRWIIMAEAHSSNIPSEISNATRVVDSTNPSTSNASVEMGSSSD